MSKSIIQTQETFKIYHEGQPDTLANIGIKLERFNYTTIAPAWSKINYYFENHNLNGYNSGV